MNTHDFSVRAADDSTQDLRDYAGRVLLIVNVASKCGLTPQYQGLETLHRDAKDGGLQILGFPCNQFGGQEPGTDADIQQFCSTSYDVTFPVFGKIDVNGPDADPLYTYIRAQVPGTRRNRSGPNSTLCSTPERVLSFELRRPNSALRSQ
jgi:glutathione peroxidase